jgi:hypothetical protein
MFFGADDQVRLIGPLRGASIPVTDIANRTGRLSIKYSIHKNAQLSIAGAPCYGNMMPLPIGDIRRTTDCPARSRCRNAERDAPAIE